MLIPSISFKKFVFVSELNDDNTTSSKWKFDQKGMASGPQAERLSDGNYLYLYNV